MTFGELRKVLPGSCIVSITCQDYNEYDGWLICEFNDCLDSYPIHTMIPLDNILYIYLEVPE